MVVSSNEPRSYLVETSHGGSLRRNRRFLKESSVKAGKSTNVMDSMPEAWSEEQVKITEETSSVNPSVDPTETSSVRRSTRETKPPARFIEQCSEL